MDNYRDKIVKDLDYKLYHNHLVNPHISDPMLNKLYSLIKQKDEYDIYDEYNVIKFLSGIFKYTVSFKTDVSKFFNNMKSVTTSSKRKEPPSNVPFSSGSNINKKPLNLSKFKNTRPSLLVKSQNPRYRGSSSVDSTTFSTKSIIDPRLNVVRSSRQSSVPKIYSSVVQSSKYHANLSNEEEERIRIFYRMDKMMQRQKKYIDLLNKERGKCKENHKSKEHERNGCRDYFDNLIKYQQEKDLSELLNLMVQIRYEPNTPLTTQQLQKIKYFVSMKEGEEKDIIRKELLNLSMKGDINISYKPLKSVIENPKLSNLISSKYKYDISNRSKNPKKQNIIFHDIPVTPGDKSGSIVFDNRVPQIKISKRKITKNIPPKKTTVEIIDELNRKWSNNKSSNKIRSRSKITRSIIKESDDPNVERIKYLERLQFEDMKKIDYEKQHLIPYVYIANSKSHNSIDPYNVNNLKLAEIISENIDFSLKITFLLVVLDDYVIFFGENDSIINDIISKYIPRFFKYSYKPYNYQELKDIYETYKTDRTLNKNDIKSKINRLKKLINPIIKTNDFKKIKLEDEDFMYVMSTPKKHSVIRKLHSKNPNVEDLDKLVEDRYYDEDVNYDMNEIPDQGDEDDNNIIKYQLPVKTEYDKPYYNDIDIEQIAEKWGLSMTEALKFKNYNENIKSLYNNYSYQDIEKARIYSENKNIPFINVLKLINLDDSIIQKLDINTSLNNIENMIIDQESNIYDNINNYHTEDEIRHIANLYYNGKFSDDEKLETQITRINILNDYYFNKNIGTFNPDSSDFEKAKNKKNITYDSERWAFPVDNVIIPESMEDTIAPPTHITINTDDKEKYEALFPPSPIHNVINKKNLTKDQLKRYKEIQKDKRFGQGLGDITKGDAKIFHEMMKGIPSEQPYLRGLNEDEQYFEGKQITIPHPLSENDKIRIQKFKMEKIEEEKEKIKSLFSQLMETNPSKNDEKIISNIMSTSVPINKTHKNPANISYNFAQNDLPVLNENDKQSSNILKTISHDMGNYEHLIKQNIDKNRSNKVRIIEPSPYISNKNRFPIPKSKESESESKIEI